MGKDNIELPPLPSGLELWNIGITAPDGVGRSLQEYAIEAIKADRQQRGEPVAVIRFERNKPGNENEMPKVISCNRLPDGDYQVFLAPQPAEVPFCEECGDGIMAHDPGICGTCYDTKYMTPQPAEPAKDDSDALTVAYMSGFYDGNKAATPAQEPSDDDLLAIQEEYFPSLALWRSRYLEVARALLARYGHPVEPEGWRLVPKEPTHEMIVAFVEQWYCHRQSIDDPQMDDAYQAMIEAAPKFGEEE